MVLNVNALNNPIKGKDGQTGLKKNKTKFNYKLSMGDNFRFRYKWIESKRMDKDIPYKHKKAEVIILISYKIEFKIKILLEILKGT